SNNWSGAQHQMHEQSACNRSAVIRFDRFKPQVTVECNGRIHFAGYGIKTHEGVPNLARLLNELFRKSATNGVPAKFRTHIKSLHFARAVLAVMLERTQRAHGGRVIVPQSQQQPARGWSVLPREGPQFVVKSLETKLEFQPCRIFQHHLARDPELLLTFGMDNLQHGSCPVYSNVSRRVTHASSIPPTRIAVTSARRPQGVAHRRHTEPRLDCRTTAPAESRRAEAGL